MGRPVWLSGGRWGRPLGAPGASGDAGGAAAGGAPAGGRGRRWRRRCRCRCRRCRGRGAGGGCWGRGRGRPRCRGGGGCRTRCLGGRTRRGRRGGTAARDQAGPRRRLSVGGHGGCGSLLRDRLLHRGALFGSGLLWLDRPTQSVRVGLAPDPVGLGVLNGRRVALHPNAQRQAQVEGLFVGQPELTAEFVDADLLCQLFLLVVVPAPFRAGSGSLSSHIALQILHPGAVPCARRRARRPWSQRENVAQPPDRLTGDLPAQRPGERP